MFFNCLLVLCTLVPMSIQYDIPECRPPTLLHGRVKLRQRAKLARFMCLPGFELVGSKYASCRNDRWDVELPVCVRSGCEVPSIENGITMRRQGGARLVFFCSPGFRLSGSEVIYCDGLKWNASIPTCVDNNAPAILSCDFENPDLCGWIQDEIHNFDWTRYNKKTPSSFMMTGPSFDHTFGAGHWGHFMYIESTSRRQNDMARLISPEYDASLAKGGCFSFFYHMYGQSMGGLRVYQKPLSVNMTAILHLPDAEKQKYLLFEKWRNQGDFWYQSVSSLKDFSENFQIIIEGIRGPSFTSDIAIDDVSILTADSCGLELTTTTQHAYSAQSCEGRCEDETSRGAREVPAPGSCTCAVSCLAAGTCCLDFLDVCVFPTISQSTTDDIANSSMPENYSADLQPKTEKLVGTTTQKTTITTTTPTTTTQATTTTKTTTFTPTTTLTTKKVTPRIISTTVKTTTQLQRRSTTSKVTTKQPTTHSTPTKNATKSHGVLPTVERRSQYHEMVETENNKKPEERNKQAFAESSKISKNTAGSAIAGTAIVLLVLALFAATFVGVRSRSPRVCVEFARVRSRATNDPEVRYLNSEDNDDD